METSVRIRDVMTRRLITSSPDDTVQKVASTMAENRIGSVIITEDGDNEGIVTERDICYKVVAKGLSPSKVLAKEIMTKSLVTISSDSTIIDAAKLMVKKGIRRLVVVESEKIVGILTASDILAVSPETMEVLRELYEIYAEQEEGGLGEGEEGLSEGGTCELCGTFVDRLRKVNGKYLCDDCSEDIEG